MVVSLIGALLKEKPNRWHYYLRQLQQKQFKRIRKSSSYDYDALDQAMSASIEVLPDEHREFYKDLTVLENDIKVPAKVRLLSYYPFHFVHLQNRLFQTTFLFASWQIWLTLFEDVHETLTDPLLK